MASHQHPLEGLDFSLVGPGRVGTSLAHWIVALGGSLQQVAGSSAASAAPLAESLGADAVVTDDLSTEGEGLLLLAVPDALYANLATRLARRAQGAVALHTAGSLGAAPLAPLRAGGTEVGTFHPLMAFPGPRTEPAAAASVFFALGGDPGAVTLGGRLASALGGHGEVVADEARLLYHLAATLAAGGVSTVLATAEEVAHRLGLSPAVATGLRRLASGAVEQAIARKDAAAAITGPAVRGDRELLERYRRRLDEERPELRALVDELWRWAERLARD